MPRSEIQLNILDPQIINAKKIVDNNIGLITLVLKKFFKSKWQNYFGEAYSKAIILVKNFDQSRTTTSQNAYLAYWLPRVIQSRENQKYALHLKLLDKKKQELIFSDKKYHLDEPLAIKEQKELLIKIIEKIDGKPGEVIRQLVFKDKRPMEIARAMKVSKQCIGQHLKIAKNIIKAKMVSYDLARN